MKIVGTEFGTHLDANYSVLVNMITPLQVIYFCFARKQIDHTLDFVLKFIYSEKATKIVILKTYELYLFVSQANYWTQIVVKIQIFLLKFILAVQKIQTWPRSLFNFRGKEKINIL